MQEVGISIDAVKAVSEFEPTKTYVTRASV